MPERATETPAVRGRRRARQQEWQVQRVVARMLSRCLPQGCFATALENAPRSAFAGQMARLRGTRAGLPDWVFVWRGAGKRPRPVIVCIELKSRAGIASKAQRQVRDELVAVGCKYWLARAANAAMTALHLSGVPVRNWTPRPLAPWEGPFRDPYARLPMHPAVRRERQAAARRYRERRRQRDAGIPIVEPAAPRPARWLAPDGPARPLVSQAEIRRRGADTGCARRSASLT